MSNRPLVVLAHHLAPLELPPWLAERCFTRVAGRMMSANSHDVSWRFLAALAVDEARTPASHRSLQRVMLSFDPGSSWGLDVLADRSGLSTRQVRRCLGDLHGWGWLHVERRNGRTSLYTACVPIPEPPNRSGHRPAKLSTTADTLSGVEPGSDRLTPYANVRGTADTLSGGADTLSGVARTPRPPRYVKGPGDDVGKNATANAACGQTPPVSIDDDDIWSWSATCEHGSESGGAT